MADNQKNIRMAMRQLVKDRLAATGVAVVDAEFTHLHYPGLRDRLVKQGIALDDPAFRDLDTLKAELDGIKPATNIGKRRARSKKADKKPMTWGKKIKYSLVALALLVWAFTSLGWQSFIGLLAQVVILAAAVWGFYHLRKDKVKGLAWFTSATVLVAGALAGLQAVHSADGDPNSWFRFIQNPNWVMVLGGITFAILASWFAFRLAKTKSHTTRVMVLIVVLIFTILVTFGLGDWLIRQVALKTGLVRPITTGP